MPEPREESTPNNREEGPGSEIASQSGTLEIIERIYIDINVVEKDGAKQIVDNDTKPREENLEAEGFIVDKINMDALEQFFQDAGVHFVGDPYTVVDQRDFLGSVSISCSDINTALRTSKLVLNKIQNSDTYQFEGLKEFVEKFIDEHSGDSEYDPEDGDAEIE